MQAAHECGVYHDQLGELCRLVLFTWTWGCEMLHERAYKVTFRGKFLIQFSQKEVFRERERQRDRDLRLLGGVPAFPRTDMGSYDWRLMTGDALHLVINYQTPAPKSLPETAGGVGQPLLVHCLRKYVRA